MPALKPQLVTFNIATGAIVKIFAVLLGLWFLYIIRDVVVMIFVALMLAAVIDPFADWLQKRNIPRGIAVLAIYILLLGAVSALLILIIPPLLDETGRIVKNFGSLFGRVIIALGLGKVTLGDGGLGDLQRLLSGLGSGVERGLAGAFSTITGFFGGLLGFVVVLVMTFYMVVEENALRRFFRAVAPESVQPYLAGLLTRVQEKIGAWLRGQLALSAAVAVLVYIGLSILGVEYALVLALLAGLAEFVPYAGPVVAAIPAVIIGLADSSLKGVLTMALYLVIQQIENNFLVPKIMQRVIGLNPIISIVSLLIGARVGGVVGAILAIPLATAVSVFAADMIEMKRARGV